MLTVASEIALFSDVGELKQPVAVPILSVRTVAKSQKRPVMFGQVPNITGAATLYKASSYDGTSGAFYRDSSGSTDIYYETIPATTIYSGELLMNANKVNSLYVGSKHQPSALQVLPCIRF